MPINLQSLKTKLLANKVILAIVLVVLVIAIVPSLYFYNQYAKTQTLLKSPNKQAEAEAKVLIAQIGQLIELPKGENPTVATVSDKTKLLDQPFFANSENGDKVLIYSLAKKAILYRPSTNKIIEVAPINLGSGQSPIANPTSPTASITNTPVSITPVVSPTVIEKIYQVAIYNGTLISGFASSTQKDLESKTTKFQVIKKGDASKSDYTKTLVVDLKDKNKSAAQELAGLVDGKVGALPTGEKSPTDADFLVILGK